ncbi:MAG: endospore germination permease [Eubacteriales bacterium]|nr:endospore germination permease [Eubacteriales bacterium]
MKELISRRQVGICAALYALGCNVEAVGMISQGGRDGWLAVALAFLLIYVYFCALKFFPGRSVFQIYEDVLGKALGKLAVVGMLLLCLFNTALNLSFFSEVIGTLALVQTPALLTICIMAGTAALLVKVGIEGMARLGEIVLWVVVAALVFTLVLSASQARSEQLLPVFSEGAAPVLKGALNIFIRYFGDFIFFTAIAQEVHERKKVCRSILPGVAIAGAVMIALVARNYMMVQYRALEKMAFPGYIVAGLIDLGDFFQRLEVLTALVIQTTKLFKVAVQILFISKGMAHLCKGEDYRFFAGPVGLLSGAVTLFLCKSILEYYEILRVYDAAGMVLYYALPLLFAAAAVIRARFIRKRNGDLSA